MVELLLRGFSGCPHCFHARRVAVNAGDGDDLEFQFIDPLNELFDRRRRSYLSFARADMVRFDEDLFPRQLDDLKIFLVTGGHPIDFNSSVAIVQHIVTAVGVDGECPAGFFQTVRRDRVR
jgi:hypothetical protein